MLSVTSAEDEKKKACEDDSGTLSNNLDVDSFDFVHFVFPDINGIPRGRIVPRKFAWDTLTLKHRHSLPHALAIMGPNCEFELPIQTTDFPAMDNRDWTPLPSTLLATPWSDSGGRRTASVLCQLTTREGTVDDLDTRHMVQRLLHKLRHDHGLILKTAFEYEFVVQKKDTPDFLGSNRYMLCNTRDTQPDLDLVQELSEVLAKGGFHVTSIQPEYAPGQWELNFEPQEGLWAADFAFHVKNAIKVFFAQKGYVASFMSWPTFKGPQSDTALHMNHSLWTEDGRNAMLDLGQDRNISQLALRWNAGLLHHVPAMTAFCCPTINCYRRVDFYLAPSHATWDVETRNCQNRFKVSSDNVYLESRLPSGVSSPYLIMACHLAAGLHGLQQQMTSPPAGGNQDTPKRPTSLEEAFQALENDDVMIKALGRRFVSTYVKQKRQYEIKPFREAVFSTEEEKFQYEREMYLEGL